MLLTARYVITGVTDEHIEDGAVLVRDGRIADVGYACELRRSYPDEEVRDFGLAALMPGFVDCHTRLEYAVMRGITNDAPYVSWRSFILGKAAQLDLKDWENAAVLGAYEAVSSGITTVADVTHTGASIEAIRNFGLRSIVYREVGARTRDEIEPELERAVNDIASWKADAALTQLHHFGIATRGLYLNHPEMLGAVAGYAAETGIPVCVDMAGTQEEYNFIRYGYTPFSPGEDDAALQRLQSPALMPTGVSPVRYALNWNILDCPNVLAIQCVKVDDADIEALAERDVRVCVCPRENAKLGMGVAPIIKMQQEGVIVGLGTGSSAACDSIDPIQEMRFAMLVQRATNGRGGFITGPAMVRMATIDSARALRMDDVVGTLEPDKYADIVAVDLSQSRQVPTLYPNSAVIHTSDRDNVLMTMIGGKVVYDAQDPFSVVPGYDAREIKRAMQGVERARAKLREED